MDNIGNLFKEKDEAVNDYHIITTKHPYMADIGMSVFTTGTLHRWWYKTEAGNTQNYVNQKYFKDGYSGPQGIVEGAGVSGHFFTGWDQNLKRWESHKEVGDNGGDWKWSNHDGTVNYTASQLSQWLTPGGHFQYPPGFTVQQNWPNNPDPVTQTNLANIIEMNNWYINQFAIQPDERINNNWNDDKRAASQFIRGIKTSLNSQGVMWSGLIPFRLGEGILTGGATGPCIKEEWVTFQLQLFDSKNPKKRSRKAALDLSELNLVGTPIDSLGIEYRTGTRRDGEHDSPATNGDPSSQVAAPLDLTYNEFTGKLESGTPQIMGILETDVPAAVNDNGVYPSVTDLQSLENTEILTTTSNAYFNPGTGLAMPIMMQNGNPLQWSPQYKEARGCRKTTKKRSVPVVNISSRSYPSGTTVILSKINGAWVPIDFGEGPGEAAVSATFEGKWQFTYLMTNHEYFFQDMTLDSNGDPQDQKIINGTEYEDAFWHEYYNESSVGGEDDTSFVINNDRRLEFGIGSLEGFSQTTSWDFMGTGIGGVRSDRTNYIEGHSIAGTQGELNTQNEPLTRGDTRGTHNAPFWGCVFPGGSVGGYDAASKFNPYKDAANGFQAIGIEQINNHADPGASFFSNAAAIPTTAFFDPNNDENLGDGSNGGGMFSKGSSALTHLPADIGTNASPSGENGMPIVDQNRINHYMTLGGAYHGTSTNNTSLPARPAPCGHKNSEAYFKDYDRYAWMNLSADAGGTALDKFSSAFDLAPTDPTMVQFRPLRAETYANFDVNSIAVANSTNDRRGEIGARNWKFVNDGESPVSWNVLDRSRGLHGTANVGDAIRSPPSSDTLRHGYHDCTPGDTSDGCKTFSGFDDDVPSNYFSAQIYQNKGMGAYGIIGTVCTVRTAGDITISTDPQIGMRSNFLGGLDGEFTSSWAGGDRISHPRTTIMYGRVFTSWLRDLTVYDPRYFAVHHFNPGVGKADEDTDWQWYNNGAAQGFDEDPTSSNFGGLIEPDTGASPPDELGYPNNWYAVWDVDTTEVDLSWPTVTSATDDGEGIFAAQYTKVYNNRVIGSSVGGTTFTENQSMRSRAHWNITDSDSRKRRGKLLPYFYQKTTIGMADNPVTVSLGDPLTNDTSIVILNAGTGYTDADRFTTTYGTGKDLLLKPTVNGGVVDGFEVVDTKLATVTPYEGKQITKWGTGHDYSPADFISYDKIYDGTSFLNVEEDTTSSLRLVPVNTNGEGLLAYFIRGTVTVSFHVDERPKEVTDGAVRLTKQPGRDDKGNTEVLTDTKESKVETGNVSADKRYDIFMFFQNETSHTFSDDGLSWLGSPQAHEQFVNVSISFG